MAGEKNQVLDPHDLRKYNVVIKLIISERFIGLRAKKHSMCKMIYLE
jgi:hypothetical protein